MIPSFLGHRVVPQLYGPVQKNGRYFGIEPSASKKPDWDRFEAILRTRKLVYEI